MSGGTASGAEAVAVVGTGPAGLMAADVLGSAGVPVTLFDKRPGPARKLYIAGATGLNLSNGLPLAEMAAHYSGPEGFWRQLLTAYGPERWLEFVSGTLGLETFLGTSGRYFVREMHAGGLVRAWRQRLTAAGVSWRFGAELSGLTRTESGWWLRLAGGETAGPYAAVCLALGGGSYEPDEVPLRWPGVLAALGCRMREFVAANVGYCVAWPPALLTEAEGEPLKNVRLTTARGERQGELVITAYGLEGTPVYFTGTPGAATLDLKPDLPLAKLRERCHAVKENLAPMRRIDRRLGLGKGALALLYHLSSPDERGDLELMLARVKALPLTLLGPQPLAEAISSGGGLDLAELDPDLMIGRLPGVFAAGEMLDWDAPTGGFLIQGCVTTGYLAGQGVLRYLGRPRPGGGSG